SNPTVWLVLELPFLDAIVSKRGMRMPSLESQDQLFGTIPLQPQLFRDQGGTELTHLTSKTDVSLVAAAFSESRRNHMTKLVKSSEIVSPRYVQTAQHAINAQPLPTPDLTPSQILRRVVALLGGTDRDRARPSVPDPGRK
ncbi:hypothetical protein LTR40_013511, partial [Exophiala xenobiotica]